MKTKTNKFISSILIALTILPLLLLETALSSMSYAQKRRMDTQHNKQRISIQTYPPGYIATAEEAKKVRESLLAGTGNDHDDPMNLAEYGDIAAVPAMLAVLKRYPANADGSMICTRWHCLAALKKLTKAAVGNETEDWEKWWEEYQQERKVKRKTT